MRDYKYKAQFKKIAIANVVSGIKQSQKLSIASLDELKKIIPKSVDLANNESLMYGAANSFVANRVNKNSHGILGSTAVSLAQKCVNTYIDYEHDKSCIVGHVINAGASEFGSNKILDLESLKDSKDAFNVALAMVFYKVVNPDLAAILAECSDETSPYYQELSISWEVLYDEYFIAVGSRDLNEAELVTEDSKIQELTAFLTDEEGGTGKLEDGTNIYRVITGSPLPTGFGVVENPAAEVKGIKISEASTKETKIEEKISQNINTDVKRNKNMKIKKLDDITNDLLKEIEASSVISFIKDELEKAGDEYAAKEQAIKAESDLKTSEAEKAAQDLADAVAKTKVLEDKLAQIEADQKAIQAKHAFDARMAKIDEEFELEDEDRNIIASDIKDLDEDGFSAWYNKFNVFAKEKNKSFKAKKAADKKAADEEAAKEKNGEKEVKASVEEEKEKADKALEGKKESDAGLPNGGGQEVSLADQVQSAFGDILK